MTVEGILIGIGISAFIAHVVWSVVQWLTTRYLAQEVAKLYAAIAIGEEYPHMRLSLWRMISSEGLQGGVREKFQKSPPPTSPDDPGPPKDFGDFQ